MRIQAFEVSITRSSYPEYCCVVLSETQVRSSTIRMFTQFSQPDSKNYEKSSHIKLSLPNHVSYLLKRFNQSTALASARVPSRNFQRRGCTFTKLDTGAGWFTHVLSMPVFGLFRPCCYAISYPYMCVFVCACVCVSIE